MVEGKALPFETTQFSPPQAGGQLRTEGIMPMYAADGGRSKTGTGAFPFGDAASLQLVCALQLTLKCKELVTEDMPARVLSQNTAVMAVRWIQFFGGRMILD